MTFANRKDKECPTCGTLFGQRKVFRRPATGESPSAEVAASMSLENDIETHFTVFADYDKHPELRPERPSDPTKKRIMHIRVMRALSALREADEQVAALQARLARFEGPLTEAKAEGICESTCNMLDPEHVQSIDIASLAVRRGR